jgi:hypothetical protein
MSRFPARSAVLGCLLAAVFAGLTAGPAAAVGLSPAVADCNQHGTLTRAYGVAELRTALSGMPADIAEYTDCHDVIQQQLLAQLGQRRGSGAGSGGGSFLPTPLVGVLIALGLVAAAYAGLAVRQRLTS